MSHRKPTQLVVGDRDSLLEREKAQVDVPAKCHHVAWGRLGINTSGGAREDGNGGGGGERLDGSWDRLD